MLALQRSSPILAACPSCTAFLAVAYIPWYGGWKISLYLRGMKPGRQQWVRTERAE